VVEEQNKDEIVKTRTGKEANRLIAKQYELGWAHAKSGRPVAWVMYGPPREILRSFDILDIYPEAYAATCAIKHRTSPYMEYGEEEGFSQYICGYLRLVMGYARSMGRGESTENALFAGMPRPSMFLSSSRLCDPRTKVFETIRRYLDVPAFIFDHQLPPVEELRSMNKQTAEHYIQHNMEGFKGLVDFLEEQTGKKLDRDRLSELVRNSIEAWRLIYDSFEMRKNSPCPMPWEDYMVAWRPFRDMAGEAQTVQFYRNMLEEMRERVKLGISVVPEEKYRLMWLGAPMWFDVDLLNYLESLGAVVVVDSHYHATRPREVDTSDPFRALAEKEYWGWDMYGESDGSQPRCGLSTGSHILELARDYHVDGVISHSIMSCRAATIGTRHMEKVLREQMGLPVLSVVSQSHTCDSRSYSSTEMREKIDVFINILEERK
jgi:benzoyl-CoA reductase/2-hydroxyglutaryl-CoA dehydratase subunit BcrC/BadD/HgdB